MSLSGRRPPLVTWEGGASELADFLGSQIGTFDLGQRLVSGEEKNVRGASERGMEVREKNLRWVLEIVRWLFCFVLRQCGSFVKNVF